MQMHEHAQDSLNMHRQDRHLWERRPLPEDMVEYALEDASSHLYVTPSHVASYRTIRCKEVSHRSGASCFRPRGKKKYIDIVGTEKVALFVDQFSPGCEANDAAATVATAKIGGISWGEGRCGRWSVSGQLVKVSN